jgi:hypothetical protein
MSLFLSTLKMVSSQLIRARMVFAALGAVFFLSGMAYASLIPFLSEGPIDLGNGTYRYDYRIVLSADERVDPEATNGVTCPGPNNANIQCNPPGTFVTIYDVPGVISANATSPFWSSEIRLLGLTPNSINSSDSNALANVVWQYDGEVINGPLTFFGFSLISTFNGINPVGNFNSQSTNNTDSPANGTSDQVVGTVPIPIRTSTAAMVTVGGRITAPSGKGISGVKVTMTGTNGGEPRTAISGDSGYYSFPDVEVGEAYLITVTAKRYTFAQSTQLQMVLDERSDINFIARPVRIVF